MPLLRFSSVLLGLLSVGIVWNETMVAVDALTHLNLSWINQMTQGMSDISLQIATGLPFLYMTVCTYFSLFNLRLFSFYSLHPRQQTEGGCLLFNAALLCRLVPPLSFNFMLTISDELKTGFVDIMGTMNVVPLFGSSFSVVFSSLTLVFCLMNLFDVFSYIATTCPGVKRFQFRAEVTDNVILDGQEMLSGARRKEERKRGLPAGQGRHDDDGQTFSLKGGDDNDRRGGWSFPRGWPKKPQQADIELEDGPLSQACSHKPDSTPVSKRSSAPFSLPSEGSTSGQLPGFGHL